MTIDRAPLDDARLEAFAGRLLSSYTESMVTLMIDVGFRTGLLDTLAADSGTSAEVAERAGLVERYVRECLGGAGHRGHRRVRPGDRPLHAAAGARGMPDGPGHAEPRPDQPAHHPAGQASTGSPTPSARAAACPTTRSGRSSPG